MFVAAHSQLYPLLWVCFSTYDRLWREAMSELNEQVHIEDPGLDDEEGAPPEPVRIQSPVCN